MAIFTKFQAFVEALAEKIHNLGSDQLKVALTNSAPNVTDATLSQITEITYTFLSSRNITTTSSVQSGGTYKLVLQDLVLTSTGGSTGPFRYIVIYNDTSASDNLIAYYDYGSSITVTDGNNITIDFDPSTGFLTIA